MKTLLCFLLLLSVVTFGHAQFKYCSIDDTAAYGLQLRGINDYGQMVGNYVDAIGNPHAVLVENGKFIPLAPAILGIEYSVAFKINNHGDVVGYMCDDVNCHGFLIHKDVLTTIDYPGSNLTYPLGINDNGTIVGAWGGFDEFGNYFEKGFQLNNGTFSDLNYPNSGDTNAVDINDLGVVVGLWDTGVGSTGASAFVDWNSFFTSFQAPFPGVTLTQASGINDLGMLVGQEFTDSELANNTGHGFLKVGPSFFQLNYPGAMMTTAWDINLSGQIVGNWYDANGGVHAWLVRPGSRICPAQYSSSIALQPSLLGRTAPSAPFQPRRRPSGAIK